MLINKNKQSEEYTPVPSTGPPVNNGENEDKTVFSGFGPVTGPAGLAPAEYRQGPYCTSTELKSTLVTCTGATAARTLSSKFSRIR